MSLKTALRRLNFETTVCEFEKAFAGRESRYTFQSWYDHLKKGR